MSMTDEYANRSMSAMFDTRADADRAVAALRAEGIADVVLTGQENAGYAATGTQPETTDDRGFFEALGDFFFPDEDRYAYAEGLNRGGFLVTVSNVPAGQVDRALDILDDEGAVDLDARETEWRSSGWTHDAYSGDAINRDDGLPGTVASRTADRAGDALTGGTARDDGLPGTAASRALDGTTGAYAGGTDADGTIEVVEERMNIAKRERDAGRVRVRSYVREVPVEETVHLREEHVSIERRPVDRAATDADFQDQSIEAREYREEAVVSKDARVVEEVAVSTDVEDHDEIVRDTLRKTEVEIEDERDTTPTGRKPL